MGSRFDWFGPESWPTCSSASPSQRAHRLLLKLLMEKQGFNPYPQEWWHFTLRDEPFPETYFDFPVQ
jgi:zinc D-Ala-D-Ala dipeptidase